MNTVKALYYNLQKEDFFLIFVNLLPIKIMKTLFIIIHLIPIYLNINLFLPIKEFLNLKKILALLIKLLLLIILFLNKIRFKLIVMALALIKAISYKGTYL